jgi:hypothetical protein
VDARRLPADEQLSPDLAVRPPLHHQVQDLELAPGGEVPPADDRRPHRMDYRSSAGLDDGGVLVVGASATGVQLADEIHQSGRPVTLAVGEHVRMPRVYRGATSSGGSTPLRPSTSGTTSSTTSSGQELCRHPS